MSKAPSSTVSGSCSLCHRTLPTLSRAIGLCGDCLRAHWPAVRPHVDTVQAESRAEFDLPLRPLRHPDGVRCVLCSNECVMGEDGRGYCRLRTVLPSVAGKLVHLAGTPERGLLHWYRDPLPTNCVADWVCEGSQHRGCHNLTVFYASCTANCLFCQNWDFRQVSPTKNETISARKLAEAANSRTFCVYYFGGDPASQMPHALAASRYWAERGVHVCWETNGTSHPKLLDAAVQYSLDTGGCIKFDLKAFDEGLHIALTGISNRRTLDHFARAARRYNERPHLPLVIASTLLAPGYVGARQVGQIAQLIAALDPQIPYALLAFAPHFYMSDLPCTSVRHAEEAEAAARDGTRQRACGESAFAGLGRAVR